MAAQDPRKRSVQIAGHATSISLEPVFWTALSDLAAARGQSINALVTDIDRQRQSNLSSALRTAVLTWCLDGRPGAVEEPEPAPGRPSAATVTDDQGRPIEIRDAVKGDIGALVGLLVDDMLGSGREIAPSTDGGVDQVYTNAIKAIIADPLNTMIVAAWRGEPRPAMATGQAVACLQLTVIPGITLKGSWRGLIEGVRVSSALRGGGIGRILMEEALRRCRDRGCGLVQLTTNKQRTDAHRFYEQLGFVRSHEGFKLDLRAPTP